MDKKDIKRIEKDGNRTSASGERLTESENAGCIKESRAAYQYDSDETGYGRQGEYTLEDYYALPDEQRVELIDGVIYDMSAPSLVHQGIAGQIYRQISGFIFNNKGNCMSFAAPVDVQLDCDDRTMLQPDVLVVCDRKKLVKKCVCGAPDFVAEILSPSTKKKDTLIKLNKYMNAGVREYWLVDPDRKTVMVYVFGEKGYPLVYGFDGKIPVSVFDRECEVDFAVIYDYIGFLYE